jgi:hypothetical protein
MMEQLPVPVIGLVALFILVVLLFVRKRARRAAAKLASEQGQPAGANSGATPPPGFVVTAAPVSPLPTNGPVPKAKAAPSVGTRRPKRAVITVRRRVSAKKPVPLARPKVAPTPRPKRAKVARRRKKSTMPRALRAPNPMLSAPPPT